MRTSFYTALSCVLCQCGTCKFSVQYERGRWGDSVTVNLLDIHRVMLYFKHDFAIVILWQVEIDISCKMHRWLFKLSEWAHFSSYDIGLNSGSGASHILVCFLFLHHSSCLVIACIGNKGRVTYKHNTSILPQ